MCRLASDFGILCIMFLTVEACGSPTPFTTDRVISSPDYPIPYTPGLTRTWVWQAPSGRWGLEFQDVDLRPQTDYISIDGIDTGSSLPLLVRHAQSILFSGGPRVNITFVSQNTTSSQRPTHRGFKIRVLYGKDRSDLQRRFLNVTPPPKTTDGSDAVIIICIAILACVVLVASILVWLALRRRNQARQPSQEVSVSVNLQRIRKDSGTRYVRKTSTQSESDVPRPTHPVQRSPSNRSWATRAERSNQVRVANQNASQTTVVPNHYTIMDKTGSNGSLEGYINPSTSPHEGQGYTIRSRLPTLERVPEDAMMVELPVSKNGVSSDDGYMTPTSLTNSDTYLSRPVEHPSASIQAKIKTRSASESSEYQNIFVTGRVQIS